VPRRRAMQAPHSAILQMLHWQVLEAQMTWKRPPLRASNSVLQSAPHRACSIRNQVDRSDSDTRVAVARIMARGLRVLTHRRSGCRLQHRSQNLARTGQPER